ncbi:MAG: glycosyltransferase family 9 protein [Chlamydiota bacterium]
MSFSPLKQYYNNFNELFFPNPFDRLLKTWNKEGKKSILICWNRGLGDVALGLYGLCVQIRRVIPDVSITFLTREDLAKAMDLLEGVKVLVSKEMKRGVPFITQELLNHLGKQESDFDCILEKIDTKKWLCWQLGKLTPKLKWNASWDSLIKRFDLEKNKTYLGVHVSSETSAYYRYEKNWSFAKFDHLFNKVIQATDQKIILFGMTPDEHFKHPRIIDLRGQTDFLEMIALIKNCCSHLLAPDSGVLSIAYYLEGHFALRAVSLWADPRQGILKQKVASPNP